MMQDYNHCVYIDAIARFARNTFRFYNFIFMICFNFKFTPITKRFNSDNKT